MANKKDVDVNNLDETKKNKDLTKDPKKEKVGSPKNEDKKTVNKTTKKSSSNKSTKKSIEKKVEVKKEKEAEIPKEKDSSINKNEVKDNTIEVPNEIIKDALKQVNKEAKKQARHDFFSKVIEELIAFLVLIIVIILVTLGVSYWYKNYYKNNDQIDNKAEVKDVLKSEYKIVSYESKNNMEIINENYIAEFNKDKTKLLKLQDRNLNVLFEGEMEISKIIPDNNGNIYAYTDEDAEAENVITVYKLEDNEFKKVFELGTIGVYFSPIKYISINGYEYLIGFYGEENSDSNKSLIYNLNGDKEEINGYTLTGDYNKTPKDQSIKTRNKDYIIIKSIADKKYGLLDVRNNSITFEASYDELHTTYDGNYVAVKNGLAGILNLKAKKLVDFQYSFIDINKDYYVVCKNNKLAIMDNEFKLVSDFSFDYQITDSYRAYSYTKDNSFKSYKVNDMYLLITNNNDGINNYQNHKAYMISKDGSYKEIEETSIVYDKFSNFLYSYNDSTLVYTIYELDNNEIKNSYETSLSSYDLKNITLSKYNDDIVRVNDNIYINYKENKEVTDKYHNTSEYKYDVYKVLIDYDENEAYIYTDNIVTSTFKSDKNTKFNIRTDDTFYIIVDNNYVSVEKIS